MTDHLPLDLTDEEKRALIALLKRTLEYARFPLAPRLDPLKAILAKLDPPAPAPLPPLRAGNGPQRWAREAATVMRNRPPR
jgi:hypothetical protein